jgi:phage tail-like protein
MPTNDRKAAYFGGRFVLELDDKKPVGFVTSIDGGQFKADPVASMVGSDQIVTRYAGKPKYDDITITVGMAMSPSFWKWVKASLDNKPERRSGAIVGYDFNNCERTRRTFSNALISEVTFPALDAASKSGALLTVKFTPERLAYVDGDNSKLRMDQALNEAVKQKRWLASNFKFGLEKFKGDDSLRNAKIEAFTVKQNVINNPVGPELESRKEVGRLELPSLQVSFAETQMKTWSDWFDKTVLKGNPEQTTGAISYLASDYTTELMRVDLQNVGLASLEIEKYEAGKEGIARVKATLWVEALTVNPGKGTA